MPRKTFVAPKELMGNRCQRRGGLYVARRIKNEAEILDEDVDGAGYRRIAHEHARPTILQHPT